MSSPNGSAWSPGSGLNSRPGEQIKMAKYVIFFYFSYRYMLNVLEEIPDLKEIELHLHIFANGREEEEELRKQTELLPRVTELIVTVLQIESKVDGSWIL